MTPERAEFWRLARLAIHDSGWDNDLIDYIAESRGRPLATWEIGLLTARLDAASVRFDTERD